jgi:uncharacterized coiled-coil protein SlyX
MLVFCPTSYYTSPIILGDFMTTQKIKDTYSDDVRLALLEQSINNINSTLVRFEKRFDQIDAKIDKLDTKIDTNQTTIISNSSYASFTESSSKVSS